MVRGLCTPGGTLQCGEGSLYTRRYTTVWWGVSVHQEVHYSVVRGLCTLGGTLQCGEGSLYTRRYTTVW